MNGTNAEPMLMCPMAKACRGMMKRSRFSISLVIPALMLIGAGVLIFIEPRFLAWLMAALFVVMGIALLFFSGLTHRDTTDRLTDDG